MGNLVLVALYLEAGLAESKKTSQLWLLLRNSQNKTYSKQQQ